MAKKNPNASKGRCLMVITTLLKTTKIVCTDNFSHFNSPTCLPMAAHHCLVTLLGATNNT